MSAPLQRSVALNWTALGLRIVVSFFLLPFIVRTLGESGYGQYLFLVAIFGYSEVLDFGFRAAILRYGARLSAQGKLDQLNRMLGSIFQYYAIIALLVLGVGLAANAFPRSWMAPQEAGDDFHRLILYFAVVAGTIFFRVGWKAVLCSRERYDLSNLIDLGSFGLRTALVLLLLPRRPAVEVLILADLADHSSNAIGHRLVLLWKFPDLRPNWRGARGEDRKAVASYSAWVFLNSISSQLRFRAPNLLIGATLSATGVAFFGVAGRLQSYVFQIATAMSAPFRPRFAALEGAGDWPALRELYLRGTRLIILLAFTLTGVLFVWAPAFLVAWMGPEFLVSANVLRLLLPALAIETASLVGVAGLYAVGRHQLLSGLIFAEATLIVGAGLGLVGRFGVEGVAAGVAIPIVLNKLFFQSFYTWRALELRPAEVVRRAILRPTLAIVLALPLAFLLRRWMRPDSLALVLAGMFLSVLLVALFAWFLALVPEERAWMRARLKRLRPGG